MKYQVLVEKEISNIDKICVICLSYHIESECPELYYSEKVKN